nr:hypothetical protein [Candidatus Sigynarchaeota archaeon]
TPDPVAFWIEISILVVLAISGFSLGNGFLQYSRTKNDHVKEMDVSLAGKRFLQGLLTFIDSYFVVLVVILGARVLLDVFGVLYAEPVLVSVLEAILVWPFAWEIAGCVLFTLKFWWDKKLNLDFSMKKSPNMIAPDKVFLHRVLLVFFTLVSTWVLLLVDFFAPVFPAATVFGIFVLMGFFTSPVKEIIY